MPTALVTGASRGIGLATVKRLAAAGWEIHAGVRSTADAAALGALGAQVTPVLLDVTDAAQIEALGAALPEHLDAVVNNAGIVVSGPLEAVPAGELRRQLEINVVGQLAVTQAVLPRLRASRGRVVFVSSVSGRMATPMTGAYNASKFALEGMADALRLELRPWGIRVVLVEPSQTDTDMWRTAEAELEQTVAAMAPEHRELYAGHIEGMRRLIPRAKKMMSPVEGVATSIEHALTSSRPRARYVVGTGPRVQAAVMMVLPTPLRDGLLRAVSGVPRKA